MVGCLFNFEGPKQGHLIDVEVTHATSHNIYVFDRLTLDTRRCICTKLIE